MLTFATLLGSLRDVRDQLQAQGKQAEEDVPGDCVCTGYPDHPMKHLLCCWLERMHFEMHDTLIDSERLRREANGYADNKR